MGLVLTGMLTQPCQGSGFVGLAMKALSAMFISVAPKSYEAVTTAYSTKLETEELKKPEKDQNFDATAAKVPRKSIAAAIFGVSCLPSVAAHLYNRYHINNVANISVSPKLYAGDAFKCAIPGAIALGSIYTSQSVYEKILNGKYSSAFFSLAAVAVGIFGISLVSEQLRTRGINENVENTLKSWNSIKGQFPQNTILDGLAVKIANNQLLTAQDLKDAYESFRLIGFDKTISGTVIGITNK